METGPDALAYDATAEPRPVSVRVRALQDIAFGSVAGMVSKVFEHPFDLCKVRLQAQVLDAEARFSGPWDCLTKTWKTEGVRGLYRGLPAPIVGAMAENASLFLAYSELQNVIRWVKGQPLAQPMSIPQLAVAAGGAGAITSFLLTPIELVKCKMQVQMLITGPAAALGAVGVGNGNGAASATLSSKPPGPFSVVASVVRADGLRGLWLGHTGTIIRETGGSAAWFATKEAVASFLLARRTASVPSSSSAAGPPRLLPWESALSGACAGASYNLALFPADTVKSTMQTEAELRPRAHGAPRPTFVGIAREMWRKQGVRGLYAGCGVTIVRSIPSSAIIFLIYDGLKGRFG